MLSIVAFIAAAPTKRAVQAAGEQIALRQLDAKVAAPPAAPPDHDVVADDYDKSSTQSTNRNAAQAAECAKCKAAEDLLITALDDAKAKHTAAEAAAVEYADASNAYTASKGAYDAKVIEFTERKAALQISVAALSFDDASEDFSATVATMNALGTEAAEETTLQATMETDVSTKNTKQTAYDTAAATAKAADAVATAATSASTTACAAITVAPSLPPPPPPGAPPPGKPPPGKPPPGAPAPSVRGLPFTWTTADWTVISGTSHVNVWTGSAISSDNTKMAACDGNAHNHYMYYSTNAGATWTQLTAMGKKGWKHMVKTANDKLFAIAGWGGGGGLFTSTDFGQSWTQDPNTLIGGTDIFAGAQYTSTIATNSADGTKVLMGAGSDGNTLIYLCTDYGTGNTWTDISAKVLTPADLADHEWNGGKYLYPFCAMNSDGQKMACGIGGYDPSGGKKSDLYMSADGGTTWEKKTPDGTRRAWFGVSMSADGAVVVAVAEGTSQIFVSKDSGSTWASKSASFGRGAWTNSVLVSADGTTIVAGGQGGSFYISEDSGDTFSTSGSTSGVNGISMSDDMSTVAFSNAGYGGTVSLGKRSI